MRAILAVLVLLSAVARGSKTLVYGPGTLQLKLLTAKYLGEDAAVYAGDDERVASKWRRRKAKRL